MGNALKTVCFFLGLWLIAPGLFPQEAEAAETIPDALRRPEWGEAPRYPQDIVIGELGQGEAPEGAYRFAAELLRSLTAGNENIPAGDDSPALTGNLLEEIRSIAPRSFRLGGGRIEPDGSVSFLVRFHGRRESIAGELFLRQAGEEWALDDLIIEEKKDLSDINDSYRYDFSPYERFF